MIEEEVEERQSTLWILKDLHCYGLPITCPASDIRRLFCRTTLGHRTVFLLDRACLFSGDRPNRDLPTSYIPLGEIEPRIESRIPRDFARGLFLHQMCEVTSINSAAIASSKHAEFICFTGNTSSWKGQSHLAWLEPAA